MAQIIENIVKTLKREFSIVIFVANQLELETDPNRDSVIFYIS